MLGEQVNVNARDLGHRIHFVRVYEQCSAKLNTAINTTYRWYPYYRQNNES